MSIYVCICVCTVHSAASSWFGSRHSSFIHSSENMINASEHSFYMEQCCVVNLNIGLTGKAVKGKNWKTHRKTLLDIFVRALTFSIDTIGMLVSEVGSVSDPYDHDDKNAFDRLFEEAFRIASIQTGASEHNKIQIFWATGNAAETAMIFKSHVKVTMLDTIFLPNSWRRVEVARIQGATEHNEEVSIYI